MASHTVLIGYGDTGRTTAEVLPADQRTLGLVVVDTDPDRVVLAMDDGAISVLGDGCDTDTLRVANVPDAARVIVAVADDVLAMRIVSAVRRINEETTIIVLVRESRWCGPAEYLGADQVVNANQIVGRLLGLSVRRSMAGDRTPYPLTADLDLVAMERSVREREVGRAPSACGALVLALVRDGVRVWLDDQTVVRLRPDDRLVVVRAFIRDEVR